MSLIFKIELGCASCCTAMVQFLHRHPAVTDAGAAQPPQSLSMCPRLKHSARQCNWRQYMPNSCSSEPVIAVAKCRRLAAIRGNSSAASSPRNTNYETAASSTPWTGGDAITCCHHLLGAAGCLAMRSSDALMGTSLMDACRSAMRPSAENSPVASSTCMHVVIKSARPLLITMLDGVSTRTYPFPSIAAILPRWPCSGEGRWVIWCQNRTLPDPQILPAHPDCLTHRSTPDCLTHKSCCPSSKCLTHRPCLPVSTA